ncbi:hypothetical protein [Cetobacterium sp.]|uniref:hypothetical protein n=1 Tax=Cetobacterium sp. TaxID=2071632 RepID=UPI003EE50DB6
MEQEIRTAVNSLSLEFSDFGNIMNDKVGIIEIFYTKPQNNIIRKNRIEKNRITKLKLEKHFKLQTYQYLVNLDTFWENFYKFFPKRKIGELEFYTIFNKTLRKTKIKSLKNNKLKISNISLLPEFNHPYLLLEKNPQSIFFYFEKLRKKLKNKKNYYFILRQAEVNHNMKMSIKDNSLPSKKKERKIIKVGDDYNRDRKKFVLVKRIIDKDTNLYGEEVKDKETNEIIRECYEPLKEHQGRGNAKNKITKSKEIN